MDLNRGRSMPSWLPRIDWRTAPEVLWRSLVFIVALTILIVVTTRWNRWQGRAGWQTTDDAYLQADLTPLAAKVPGYVVAMPVQDDQLVHAGQTIAQIFDGDYRAQVAGAEANVAAAEAQGATLAAQAKLQHATISAAEASADAAKAALDQNGRDMARQAKLLESGSSTAEAGEKLATAHAQLTAQFAQTRAQAQAASLQLGVLASQAAQASAALAAQRAALSLAEINLDYTRIVAPEDGVIAQRQVKPGQYVGVGTQITSLTPLPHVWVLANYRETQLTHMAVGQKAEIRIDAYPGRVMRGHVMAFAPGAGSQFALLPPDNATGNYTKVVQRVAVKIAIDDAAGLADRLRPGLSVEAKVDAQAALPR
jgi:membrane fusion protein (multidrug efflux system)